MIKDVWTPSTRPTDRQRKLVRLLVAAGEVQIPKGGFDDGTPWPWHPAKSTDRTLNPEEITRQRALVSKRQEAAQRHGVAIGWIDHEGKLLENAKKMDGSPT